MASNTDKMTELRKALSTISQEIIGLCEVKLQFILADIVPPNSNKTNCDIFDELINLGCIAENNFSLVHEILFQLGIQLLATNLPPSTDQLKVKDQISPYRRMLVVVGDSLSTDDCNRLAFIYGISKHRGIQQWDLLMKLEKRDKLGNAGDKLNDFADNLSNIGCKQLANSVTEFCNARKWYHEPLDEHLKHVSNELACHYLHTCGHISILPWDKSKGIKDIKEIFTNLDIVIEDRTYRAEFTLDKYLDIFNSHVGPVGPVTMENNRILVRGKAGAGKTTFLRRLAHDWAESARNGVSQSILDTFKLVFLLQVREMKGNQTLIQAIQSQLLQDYSAEEMEGVKKLIRRYRGDVLIMLDGYDELLEPNYNDVDDESHSSPLLRVLRVEELKSCRILVTTRPQRLKDFKQYHCFYNHFQLNGFSKENVEKYVMAYFKKDAESGRKCYAYMADQNFTEGIAEIPLMTAILCYLWENTKLASTNTGKRMSELYSCLFQFLIERCNKKCHSQKTKLRKHVTDDIISQLGKIGLQGLIGNHQLIFNVNELPQELQEVIAKACEIGIIHNMRVDKPKSPTPADDNCYDFFEVDDLEDIYSVIEEVTFFHKSAQEKCSAKYLGDLLETSPDEFSSYLEQISSVREALDLQLMLKFTCAENVKVAGRVLARLGEIYKENLEAKWEQFSCGDLPMDDLQEMQQFLELCIGCNFEAREKESLHPQLEVVFPTGFIRLTGISRYSAMSLAYLLKYSRKIQHVEILRLSVGNNTHIRELMDRIPSCRRDYINNVQVYVESTKRDIILSIDDNMQQDGSFLTQIPSEQRFAIVPISQKLKKWQAHEINMSVIFHNIQQSVTSLFLSGMKFEELELKKLWNLLDNLPRLQKLCLNNNNLGAHHATELSKYLGTMSGLKVLSLSGNVITDGFSSVLSHIQNGTFPDLEELRLEGCDIPENMLIEVVIALKNTPKLSILDIRLNLTTNSVASNLATTLSSLKQLTNINITANKIDSQGFVPLFEALGKITSLRRLYIAESHFPEALVGHIAKVAKVLPSLEYVHASGKPFKNVKKLQITTRTSEQFIDIFSNLNTLTDLDLIFIRFTEADFYKLVAAVKDLPSFKALKVSYDHVPVNFVRDESMSFIQLC